MKLDEQSKTKRVDWHKVLIALNPFTTERISYEGQDPVERSKHLLSALKWTHGLIIITIPVLFALMIILPQIGFAPRFADEKENGTILTIIFSLGSILSLVAGFKWKSISKKIMNINFFNPFDDPYMMAQISYIYRVGCFLTVIGCGFILGILGVNLWITASFFVTGGIALVLLYPSNSRWEQWVQLMQDLVLNNG